MKRALILLAACVAAAGVAGAQNGAARARPLEVYFIDVEGGAATLTVTPAGESVLVDCGWPGQGGRDPRRIQHVVKDVAGLSQIDHYVTTHWHTDHYGGVEGLSKLVPIRHFWDRGIPDPQQADSADFPTLIAAYRAANGGHSTALKAGDGISLRTAGMPLELKVVASCGKAVGEGGHELPVSCDRHPAKPLDTSDNARSLALLLHYGKFDFLNCGDLTWNIEHKLVCPQDRVGKVDLWQVTHHGSDLSSNPALVQAIEPRCAVMVNGPRKGGSPSVVRLVKSTPSVEGFYALHRNVTSSAEDNAAPDHIANPDENCRGEFFRVRLNPSGTEYSISKGEGPALQTFRVR